MDNVYCVRCKSKTPNIDVEELLNKKNRPMIKCKCDSCGTQKYRFLPCRNLNINPVVDEPMEGGDLVASLGKATKNLKLPWARFAGELHIPGMNFAGPGTNLDKRLNPSGSWKEWSKPIDRVDNAAYIHDLAYDKFEDVQRRNLADKMLLEQIDSIPNPTFREKVERQIIKPIISSKVKLGLSYR